VTLQLYFLHVYIVRAGRLCRSDHCAPETARAYIEHHTEAFHRDSILPLLQAIPTFLSRIFTTRHSRNDSRRCYLVLCVPWLVYMNIAKKSWLRASPCCDQISVTIQTETKTLGIRFRDQEDRCYTGQRSILVADVVPHVLITFLRGLKPALVRSTIIVVNVHSV
jgi:hypothetical protein